MSAPPFDALIAKVRAVPIEAELARRGVALQGRGPERTGPCPVCGGADRFSINIKKQVWNCRGCRKGGGDAISLVEHLDNVDFRKAVALLAGEPAHDRKTASGLPPAQAQPDDNEAGQRAALRIWGSAVDLRGTDGELYLRRDRQLKTGEDFSSFLRWHARSRALIGLFRDVETDEPRAITRIFIDAVGHKIGRKFLGPVGGCAIKLDADENVTMGLVVGEGLETCLAARQLGFAPTWALGSVGAIQRLPVLDGIEGLTILAEAGEPSRKLVQICFDRWRAAGRSVVIQKSTIGSDINDALRGVA